MMTCCTFVYSVINWIGNEQQVFTHNSLILEVIIVSTQGKQPRQAYASLANIRLGWKCRKNQTLA
jgi:hypothetical protein